SRIEIVLRTVRVHQVDPPGDRPDPVDEVDEVLPARVGVAGVQAEPHAVTADRVPQPGQRVQSPGARVVAARGVLDEYRRGQAAGLLGIGERLPPVFDPDGEIVIAADVSTVDDQPFGADRLRRLGVCEQQLAARYPDPVVRRGDVDQVWRVNIDVNLCTAQCVGV